MALQSLECLGLHNNTSPQLSVSRLPPPGWDTHPSQLFRTSSICLERGLSSAHRSSWNSISYRWHVPNGSFLPQLPRRGLVHYIDPQFLGPYVDTKISYMILRIPWWHFTLPSAQPLLVIDHQGPHSCWP